MRSGNQRWSWIVLGAAAVLMASGTPVLAQEAAASGESGGKSIGAIFWQGINETPIGWAIILLSITSFALIVEHFLTIRRPVIIPPDLPAMFDQWIKERQYTEMMQYLETDK